MSVQTHVLESPLARSERPPTLVAVPDSGDVPTTVGVLAQDPVTLAGLTTALGACDEVQLMSCRRETLPSVVLVASDTADESLLRTLGAVVGRGSRVVLVVPDLDGPGLLAMVDSGAHVVVPRKDAHAARLADAVRVAASGETSLPAEWLRRLVPQPGDGTADAEGPAGRPFDSGQGAALTAREVEVLRLLADGASTADIAGRLAYSESTIKTAIHALTQRLSLRNRSHAVAWALRAGLI
jgi:DNA-binding NarL/FixJ family response regulator